ncbi:MAG: glycoside hydrolase family 20 zincin-like fold domain-containing protein, partial [Tepidisphaeraceae bacterium]
KEVRLESGSFSLARPLILDVPNAQSERLGQLLNEELKRAGLPAAQVRGLDSPSPAFRLAANQAALKLPSLPNNDAAEAYAIDIRDDEVVCVAREPGGVVFGLQTLCQLIRANRQNDAIPCLSVRDWPSLRWRCFQDDMTRGPSSSLDTLKFEAALGSYLKLNLMTFYMEYQYAFRKHPKIGPPNGSLTPDELTALVDYVKPLRLNILGNQQSFGHFGQILKHPEYAQLRETRDVLAPVREETYQLLDDLYSEVCPLLPFPWFNVCCDETWGLGTGPSKELAAKIGVGGVYVRHIQRVHDLLRDKYKKRMMMWGDIILQHPGNLKDIPKDTLMLTWGYDARANFEDQIVPFAKSGYEFFVCPGVSNWNRILPDFGIAQINIRNFVRDGVKHGAIGMINTDWKDDGESLSAVKWHADAWAAECAWNASATTPEAFNRRIGAVLFGEAEDHFGQAVELLAKAHRLPGMKDMMNSRFWEKDFAPAAGPARIQATATSLLAVVRPAIQNLEACRREARCNEHVLDTLLFGARRMELIGQRMLDGLQAAQLYAKLSEHPQHPKAIEPIEQLIQKNRDVHEALAKEFATLWRVESKPYALDWTLARYARTVEDYSALLRKLADARSAATAGRPLPSPEEIGLPIPKPLARLIRPREVLATPLSPDLPWADPAATHRLGLVISAADADRFDLPVEVELALPNDLAGKPVRAFQIGDREHQRELLPQLDGSGQVDKRRLILLLPGPLPKGTEASVHVYLGLPVPPPPLATAACTHAGPSAMHWLENDRVRLLLGDEG